MATPEQRFGAELRRLRELAGMTQKEIGKAGHIQSSTVSMIESGQRTAQIHQVRCWDDLLGADGALLDMWREMRSQTLPAPLRSWLDIERTAMAVRTFQPILVPGLLQTQAYAREVIWAAQLGMSKAQLDLTLANRMERRERLAEGGGLQLWAVIDEAALRRPVGGPAVMRDQVAELITASEQGNITIQTVSSSVGAYMGQGGGFSLATAPGGRDSLYVGDVLDGRTIEDPELVAEASLRYESIKSRALPSDSSPDLLGKVMQEWTEQTSSTS